jgi:hypothetical protein
MTSAQVHVYANWYHFDKPVKPLRHRGAMLAQQIAEHSGFHGHMVCVLRRGSPGVENFNRGLIAGPHHVSARVRDMLDHGHHWVG